MTQKHPTLTPDQLLRIEALQLASQESSARGGSSNGCLVDPNFVVVRADAYLAFLKAGNLASAPKPSNPWRKK
jgi:hypothetical protein